MIAKKKPHIPTKRLSNIKSSRKLFVIASEGTKTEPDYFKNLKRIVNNASITIKSLTSNTGTSPGGLLKRISKYLEENEITDQDEAWIVMDRDQWDKDHIIKVINWTKENKHYGLALTNPKFEYWLLLHFEDGKGVQTSSECPDKLKRYLPNYDKSLSIKSFDLQKVKKAVSFLEKKVLLSNEALIEQVGTTVHVLVKKIIDSE